MNKLLQQCQDSGGAKKPNNITLETFQSDRFSVLHSTGSATLPVTTEVFTATTIVTRENQRETEKLAILSKKWHLMAL